VQPQWRQCYLYYRRRYPQIFVESDRRRTIADLRAGLGIALLIGSLLYLARSFDSRANFWRWPCLVETVVRGPCLLLAGVFMVWNSKTGCLHAAEYENDAIEVARMVKHGKEPECPTRKDSSTAAGST
jgi:hypothetical protein